MSAETHNTATSGHEPWVVLDHTWAVELGVQRSGGLYRLSRRELMNRLAPLDSPDHQVQAARNVA